MLVNEAEDRDVFWTLTVYWLTQPAVAGHGGVVAHHGALQGP